MREKLGLEDSWKKKEERKKEYNRKTFDSTKESDKCWDLAEYRELNVSNQ